MKFAAFVEFIGGRKVIALVGVSVALLLLMAAGLVGAGVIRVTSAKAEQARQVQLQKVIEEQIREAEARYNARNQNISADFMTRIDKIIDEEMTAAAATVNGIAERFSSLSFNSKLAYKVAKDRLKGTSDFDMAIGGVLEPYIRHFANCNVQVQQEFQALEHQLAGNINQLQADMMIVVGEGKKQGFNSESMAALEQELHKLEEAIVKQVNASAVFNLGVFLEAVFIKSTVQMIGNAGMWAVGKMVATTASAGAIAAAADGPMPVGDVVGATITGLGVLWSGYDLYSIKKKVPAQMRGHMHEAIANFRKSMGNDVASLSKKMVDTYGERAQEALGVARNALQQEK